MVVLGFPDKTYVHTIRYLRMLCDTLPPDQKMEMLHVLADFSTYLIPSAHVFDSAKFERFLERLDMHPEPDEMKRLLDQSRKNHTDGELSPF